MKNTFVLFLLLTAFPAFSQFSVSVIVEPSLCISKIGTEPKSTSDSFRQLKKGDFSTGLSFEFRKNLDRYASISILPSYYHANLLLVKENLQFLDEVHPALPTIRDFSQAAQKNAFLHYRQKYVGVQALYAKRLQLRKTPNKTFIELGGGMGLNYLLQNDVKIRTEGFAIKEDYIHIIKENQGVTANKLAINVIAHCDINYELSPKTNFLAGVRFTMPVTRALISDPGVYIFMPGLRVGLRFFL
jgi:hypothetical protein